MTKRKHLSGAKGSVWLLLASLLLVLVLAAPAGPASAQDAPETIPIPPPDTLVESVSLVPATGDNPKLGSSLSQLLAVGEQEGPAAAQDFAATRLLVVEGDSVQVEITAAPGAVPGVIEAIETAGGEYQGHFQDLVEAMVPVEALEALAARPGVLFVREPIRAVPDAPVALQGVDEVAVTSEGVAASNASAWHAAGYKGKNVRVAIFDGGFTGYAGLLGTELPGSVKTYDHSGLGLDGGTTHGTRVAEVVADMAPDAALSLHRVDTTVQLSKAVDQAAADGAKVISMSLSWNSGGPGDGTGPLADIAADARNQGILFAKSAGNQAQTTWSGTFVDRLLNANVYHAWDGGSLWVNFLGPGTGACYIKTAGSVIQGWLHWDDWSGVKQNYDLHLYYWPGSGNTFYRVASSTNLQNGTPGQTPQEFVSYSVPASGVGCYGWVVEKVKADRNVCFRLLTPNASIHLDKWTTMRSMPFPADAPAIMAVAAVDVKKPYNLEYYSSQGPTFGKGGTCTGGKVKPEITAYANVSTKTGGPGAFNGTSAATPHAAGAAALVRSAYPGYSPALAQNFLEMRAIDMGPAGKDTMYGAGRLWLGGPPLLDLDEVLYLPLISRVYRP